MSNTLLFTYNFLQEVKRERGILAKLGLYFYETLKFFAGGKGFFGEHSVSIRSSDKTSPLCLGKHTKNCLTEIPLRLIHFETKNFALSLSEYFALCTFFNTVFVTQTFTKHKNVCKYFVTNPLICSLAL